MLGTSALMPWVFLGQTTPLASPAIRTPLLSWVGIYQQLMFEHYVSQYSGVAAARLIVGPASGLSETGATFSASFMDTTSTQSAVAPTLANNASWSVPGWPLAGVVTQARRHGYHWVKNVATDIKTMFGQGNYNQSGQAPPTNSPSQVIYSGMFNDSTNSIQQAELAVYDATTGTAISTKTMSAGSYLIAWGRNNF